VWTRTPASGGGIRNPLSEGLRGHARTKTSENIIHIINTYWHNDGCDQVLASLRKGGCESHLRMPGFESTPTLMNRAGELNSQSGLYQWSHDSVCSPIATISREVWLASMNITSTHLTHSPPNSVIKTPFPNAFRSLTRKGPHGCVETNHAISSCTTQDHVMFDICTTRCDDRSYEHFAALVCRITMTI